MPCRSSSSEGGVALADPDEVRAVDELFEQWLTRRVAEAVEAGEVSGDLLVELNRELALGEEDHQMLGHAATIRLVAEILQAKRVLREHPWLEALREQFVLEVGEIWLAEQRRAYQQRGNPSAR